ncbi:TonB-linked outer membrane protein, SusC/RagA family [Chryseolinea serpens]|uniref:TonB-linked outer membrane protein, SusC/RagA family n=1 Tax=Chryseolinea serpens TaxID=947013 RepID=A0A1M5TMD3_9BACT|nr:TonB-dependent receptor [Chryseolinea serpens]SHH51975.1 TonB-linked outer membrane protein, SusC/RagA family [Chryseolinea serpens]
MIKIYTFLALFVGTSTLLQAGNAGSKDALNEDRNVGRIANATALDTTVPPDEEPLAAARTAQAVQGVVTSESGDPMPGVNVIEKGTSNGTTTDVEGKYALNVSGPDAVLLFTFIGYSSQEVRVGTQTAISLSLTPDVSTLQEVVVVGYGTQQKRDVTGATSTVKSDEIVKRPITRVEQALQGTTPGVVVTSNSGQPGVGLSVRIRGSNSVSGSNDPLYVIDGFIGGNIESINPNDIESLEILKDASATAIYGSRGSNGVVIITTKTGKEGAPRINFSTWFSKAMVPKQLDIMNAYDFARTVNLQQSQVGQGPAFSDAQLQQFKENGGTDWQKELQRKPVFQNYQLDMSGGSSAVHYLFSFNHLDQPGLILNQYYKRTTFRTNVDVKVNDRLDLKFKVTAVLPQSRNTQYQGDLTDPFSQANIWDPTSPVRNPTTGAWVNGSSYGSTGFNPIAQATSQQEDRKSTDVTGIGTLSYRIFKDLVFTSNNTYQIQSGFEDGLRGPGTDPGSAFYANTKATSGRAYQNSNFLTYNHSFGEHALTVTALYEQQNRISRNINGRSAGLSSYALGYYGLALGQSQQLSAGYFNEAIQSYMGRVNYSYRQKYLLTASVRTDGSSHLVQKYSTFPSVAVGWNIARESFMQSQKLFADLKLRASYGKTGNQAVPAYSSLAQITTGGPHPAYYFDGTKASVSTPLGSPVSQTLKWETTDQFDVGLDASFLEGRLTFTVDAYKKTINDLLLNYQAPFYMGGGYYQTNLGKIENKGLEFALRGTPINTGALKWNSFFTLSFNRNKVLDLGGLDNIQANNIGSAQDGAAIMRVGRPLGEFYGYEFLGTWKSSEADEAAKFGLLPGAAKYTDVNGDHAYNSADLKPIGNGTPKYSFGFINDVSYGNFTLSFMFQGTHGNQIYSQTMAYLWGGQGQAKNATTSEAMNMWSPTNETDNPSFGGNGKNFINSSRYVYDGSYVKLKNISLSYHVPTGLLDKVKMKNLEIYVSGQNVFTITHFPGYDPEINNAQNAVTQGLEMGVIPNPRTYTIGLKAGF